MEKEKMESLIIDYIDDRLKGLDRELIEEELMRNADARKLYEELRQMISAIETSEQLEPSAALASNFHKDLAEIVSSERPGKTIFFNPTFHRVAAAILLMVISGGIGYWINRHQAQQERLAEMERQMDATRAELREAKDLVMTMIGNDQSASQRLRGVNVAMELREPDKEIVNVLFRTMESDPNTNVRLAALEALSKFQYEPDVRDGLIRSLTKQSDPMVQIRLIQLMVQIKEKGVVDDLKKMVDDARTMQAVKDEAYSGILKLS